MHHHINLVDNTLIAKLPKVSYEIGYSSYPSSLNFLQVDQDFITTCRNENSKTVATLDTIFERKMQTRLAAFHALPIDRT
jgi:hypothetical protein